MSHSMHTRCLRTCLCVPEFVCVCVDLFQDCHLFHACTDVTSFYTHLIHCQRTCVGSSCRHIRIPFLSVCLLAGMQNIATITPVQQNRTEAETDPLQPTEHDAPCPGQPAFAQPGSGVTHSFAGYRRRCESNQKLGRCGYR